MPFFAELAHI